MSCIVAAATPWGHSALAVVRLSGADLDEALLPGVVAPHGGFPLPHNQVRRVDLFDDNGVFDDGVIVFSKGPRSYTGEDTAEITCHGNPQIVERLLAAFVSAGARLAEPGQFTRRAVAHGKMDLLRAEAVMQVATATTKRGLELGRHGLEGRLSETVETYRQRLVGLAAECEARLDYPADELAVDSDGEVLTALHQLSAECRALAGTHRVGQVLVAGARVALVGPVNAGKSSLFNTLLNKTRALVHDTPGTTRDVLEVACVIDGVAITLLDTAGERVTQDPVEAAGLALAQELIAEADALIVVLRAKSGSLSPEEREILSRTTHLPRVVVYNGVDRADCGTPPSEALPISAKTGAGLGRLKSQLLKLLIGEELGESQVLIASVRQRDQLLQIAKTLDEAQAAFPIAGVAVAAECITDAITVLDTLTGRDTREGILDEMFSRFCIGK